MLPHEPRQGVSTRLYVTHLVLEFVEPVEYPALLSASDREGASGKGQPRILLRIPRFREDRLHVADAPCYTEGHA
jgi:hypothetical protein